MKPVIDGEADKLHEAIFASVNYHASYEPKRAVRTERFKYIRRFDYPADNARQDVRDLRALNLNTVSTADLLEPALELALAYDVTACDATYAALARQLDLPLVTADETLQRKLTGSNITVLTLANLNEE